MRESAVRGRNNGSGRQENAQCLYGEVSLLDPSAKRDLCKQVGPKITALNYSGLK